MLVGCEPAPAKAPAVRVEPASPPPAARSAEAPPPAAEETPPDEPLPPYRPTPVTRSAPSSDPTPTRAEEKACAARGGKIEPVCMMGSLECVLRFRDGGKRCSDKKDCIGQCLYEGPQPVPAKPLGACQRTSDPCGCKAPIVNGKVSPALCTD
jgi:hypothetical protein